MTPDPTAPAPDYGATAPTYSPPTSVGANVNVAELLRQIEAMREQMQQMAAAQAAAGIAAPEPPKSPEEQARERLDRRGTNRNGAPLGIEERLNELHTIVELIAQKVGI